MDFKILLFLFLLFFVKLQALERFSCLDNDGQEVDWFVILKSPEREYHYFDNSMVGINEMMTYFYDITHEDSALNRTVNQYYATIDDDHILTLIYNDQEKPHEKKKVNGEREEGDDHGSGSNKAHMKGIIIFNGNQGIFLTHSIPGFLNKTHNIYPSNGIKHAQHAFCMTIGTDALVEISQHLYITHPHIYHMHVPDLLKNEHLENILDGDFEKRYKLRNLKFQTVGKLQVIILSRSNADKPTDDPGYKVLWDDVSDFCQEPFIVVSWFKDSVRCRNTAHAVYDVAEVQVNAMQGEQKLGWDHTNDHSKYGFGLSSKTICYGDLNHANVKARGGGTYCLGQFGVLGESENNQVRSLIDAIDKTFTYTLKTEMREYVTDIYSISETTTFAPDV